MPRSPEDIKPESWHRFFASTANYRAWQPAELRASEADLREPGSCSTRLTRRHGIAGARQRENNPLCNHEDPTSCGNTYSLPCYQNSMTYAGYESTSLGAPRDVPAHARTPRGLRVSSRLDVVD
jgi:hypothetical protein